MNPYTARKMAKVIAIVVVAAMVITSLSVLFIVPTMFGDGSCTVYAAEAENSDMTDAQLAKEATTLQEYLKLIKQNYKDPVTLETLMTGAFSGAAESLGDPYSVYFKTEEDKQNFENYVGGNSSGIGIEILIDNGNYTVVEIIPGSPAEKAGMMKGDLITEIDGKSISTKDAKEIADLICAKAGTKISIDVNRKGKAISFNMVTINFTTRSITYKMLENHIGYIKISSFDSDVDQEFTEARMALINRKAEKFIIDLRFNLGGYIEPAAEIANQIMPAGPIYYFEQQGKIVDTKMAKGAEYKFPTVLLVNENSASASELLAGALQDSKAATIVGTQTYGKGIVQQVYNVGDNKGVKLSMAYVLTPNKNRINKVGITPDYMVQNYDLAEKENLSKLYSGFAPMCEKSKPKSGDTGLNVYGAQQRLNLLGYKVEITGVMDSLTVAAVSEFQKQEALTPYGVLDITTRNALEKASVAYVSGAKVKDDLQMKKALSLLK